jgi:hypothetical protein
MPHPQINNHTAFAYATCVLADEEAVPQYVSIVQAEYSFARPGALELLEEQSHPNLAGEWHGDPASSSIKLEPHIAFMKPQTDVVMIGHAHAPHAGATTVDVGIRVGPVQKLARVTGNRLLARRGGTAVISPPQPFEEIPLLYERAFGGWDRTDEDPQNHSYDPRNPVGTGFRQAGRPEDEFPLPNIEDPAQPFRSYGERPAPAGFGFIAANWQPRLGFAGTYDGTWDKERKPLLPTDFDRRFFNGASPGLVAPGYLAGNEPVVLLGVTPQGRVNFHLPGAPAPVCSIRTRGDRRTQLRTNLDTVIVDADRQVISLQWRATMPLRDGPHEVLAIDVLADAPAK